MQPRRFAALCCLLTLVVLGGCVGVPSGEEAPSDTDDPDPEAVFEGAFVHSDDLEDVSGEMRSEVTDGNRSVVERVLMAERPYVDYRDEVLEASNPDRVGDVYVSNATTKWWYYPDVGIVQYTEFDEPFEDESVRESRAEMAAEQRELYDLEYRGTEEIADREAHVLDVEAKDEVVTEGLSVLVGDTEYVYALETIDPEDELTVVEQTIWVDAEFDYPLKEKLVFEGPEGTRHVMTEEFESVTFNSGLEDDRFAFEPPENATVEEF